MQQSGKQSKQQHEDAKDARRQLRMAKHRSTYDTVTPTRPVFQLAGTKPNFTLHDTVSLASPSYMAFEYQSPKRVRDFVADVRNCRSLREWPLLKEVRIFAVTNFYSDVQRLLKLGARHNVVPEKLRDVAVQFFVDDYRRKCGKCGKVERDWAPVRDIVLSAPEHCRQFFASEAEWTLALSQAKNAESVLLKDCGRCKRAWYCSEECQKKDWAVHKLFCHPGS